MAEQEVTSLDVILIGAGISGINAAYRIQQGLPNCSYTILEARHEMGGTWSLFRYPGIRSDSDLYTFGFAWEPWTKDNPIADAPSILEYMRTTARKHGIDQHIRYHHKVLKLEWKSSHQRWFIHVEHEGEKKLFSARFVMMGTGYYDYNEGLNTEIPGLSNFEGRVVHPQFWPDDLDYTDKKVAIIGSGATAVTILPAMNEKAKQVTMVQRSPGYFLKAPMVIASDQLIRKWLPASIAHRLIRWKHAMFAYVFFFWCRAFPEKAKKMLRAETKKELPPHIPMDPHFRPAYNPWEQRMCITPGGDFFEALRSRKSNIVTGAIDTVTKDGVLMKDGQKVDADIVITATGLKVVFGANIEITVDDEPVKFSSKFVWRGSMLQDVPNLFFVFGYVNASWTLGADASAQLFVRVVNDSDAQKIGAVIPTIGEKDNVKQFKIVGLTSTYIKSAIERGAMPKIGDVGPWAPRFFYFKDILHAQWGNITTGLQLKTAIAA